MAAEITEYENGDAAGFDKNRQDAIVRTSSAVSLAGPLFTLDTKRLEAIVKGYGKEAEIAIQKVIYKLAQETRDRMRRDAPKDTGALRAGIYISAAPNAAEQAKGSSSAQSKVATVGYSRAIRAASQRTVRQEWAGTKSTPVKKNMPRLALQDARDDVDIRTQRSDKFKAAPASHIVSRLRLNAYNEGDGDEIGSFLPMALGTRASFFITIGSAVFYSGLVEFGTVHTKAQPFFIPNMNWARAEAPGRVVAALEGIKVKV